MMVLLHTLVCSYPIKQRRQGALYNFAPISMLFMQTSHFLHHAHLSMLCCQSALYTYVSSSTINVAAAAVHSPSCLFMSSVSVSVH